MKKITSIILTLATVLLLASCEDFLDSQNLTQRTTETFPETELDAQQMVTAIYAHLLYESPESSAFMYIAQLAGDDCLGGNLSYSGNCATNFLLYKDNLNSFLDMWDRDYTLINRANSALANMDNVKSWSSESEKNRLLGETYFLRAFAYYELAQTFGGVPLRTTTDAVNIPRASVDEVYQLIGEDLAKAIELMPNRIYTFGSNMTGHATKAAAEAMQARVFLFYTGRYGKTELPNGTTKAKVISDLEDCIRNSGHDLVKDQRHFAFSDDEFCAGNAFDDRLAHGAAADKCQLFQIQFFGHEDPPLSPPYTSASASISTLRGAQTRIFGPMVRIVPFSA